MRTDRCTPRTRTSAITIAGVAVAVAALVGCGGGGDASGLSETAQRGKQTSASNGCTSCHGANGQGGVGPSWIGLAGSDVELVVPDDEGGGTRTVVADDEYLVRSILEPAADMVAGYTLQMPSNGLGEADARDIVAYINELTVDAP